MEECLSLRSVPLVLISKSLELQWEDAGKPVLVFPVLYLGIQPPERFFASHFLSDFKGKLLVKQPKFSSLMD